MKNKAVMAMALAAFLSVTTMVNTACAATVDATSSATQTREKAKKEKKEEVAEPENAIGKDAAKAKALTDAGVAAAQAGKVQAHVSTMDDGTVVYKVRFTYNDQRYSYRINAVTGAVVEKDSKAVTEDEQKGGHGNGQGKGSKSEKPTTDKTTAQ